MSSGVPRTVKAVDTPELVRLDAEAIECGLNRNHGAGWLMEYADPGAMHYLRPVLVHRAPRVPPGTFTRDPDPFGTPFEPTAEDPRVLVSVGPTSAILIHPDAVRGLSRHPDRRRLNGCCRLDGCDGPNLVCAGCGAEIATEQSDCWASWHDVRLEPAAVTEHSPNADRS